MSTTEIIDIAGEQAVKLPAEFHFRGDVVSIRRQGNAVILEPVESAEALPTTWPSGFFESIRIEDPKFIRPEQGQAPPILELD
jgi:virulence-associated protein VagC